MKYKIVEEFPHEILDERKSPCISIYQPTHRYSSDRQKDRILFKNQVREIESFLAKKHPINRVKKLLEPLYQLEKDSIFWSKTKDGIAILMNEDKCIVYNLNRRVKELAVVSDSFHIKPLIRVFQSADRYYVLGINRKTFKLYYGNRYSLDEVEMDEDVEVDIKDILGDQYTEPQVSTTGVVALTGGTDGMFFGQGSKKDEIDIDIVRYLRYVDRLVAKNYTDSLEIPLVLVALDEYQGEFRKISHNDALLEKGIHKDFESLSLDRLKEESWNIVEEVYIERTRRLVDRYEVEKGKELATDNVEDICKKAVESRVGLMLLESDRLLRGDIDMETGEIVKRELSGMGTDDLLNDLTDIVSNGGGEVVMLPKERMPTDSGLAAIYRY